MFALVRKTANKSLYIIQLKRGSPRRMVSV